MAAVRKPPPRHDSKTAKASKRSVLYKPRPATRQPPAVRPTFIFSLDTEPTSAITMEILDGWRRGDHHHRR